MSGISGKRRLAYRFGIGAERVAALLLMLKGYRILARRYRGGGGEIDIVAMRGRTIVFVEVKARQEMAAAEWTVTPAKLRRIARGARHFLTARRIAPDMTIRCDAILAAPRRWPRHIERAGDLALD